MRAAIVVGWIVAMVAVADAQPAPPAAAPPVREPCALVVVVDQSASMRGARLEAVKAAVVDILGTLDPRDEIAVVGFGLKASVVVSMQSVGNRKRIAAGVARLRAGGRGRAAAGLDAAAAVVGAASADRTRVIVITSGDHVAGAGRAARELLDVRATVSAVGLDPAAATVVAEIADAGRGRALMIDDLTALPTILVDESTISTSLDPRAFVFVIDRSNSMEGARLEAAKEAVRASIELLDATDLVAVITFDAKAQVVVPLQRATNRLRISSEVARIGVGWGANLYIGLRGADGVLAGVPRAIGTVIVLTDGESPYDGVVDLATAMASRRITIHAVGVAGADRNLLSLIADAGGGRLYLVEDIGRLPEVFRSLVPPSP